MSKVSLVHGASASADSSAGSREDLYSVLEREIDDCHRKQAQALALRYAYEDESFDLNDRARNFYHHVLAIVEWADASDRVVEHSVALKLHALSKAVEKYQKPAYLYLFEILSAVNPAFSDILSETEKDFIARSINRLPCKESARSGQMTADARMRECLHRRFSQGAHPLFPKPDATIEGFEGFVLKEVLVGSRISYVCVPYPDESDSLLDAKPPLTICDYAFIKRWNPAELEFETIIRPNMNSLGLHFHMAGHAEYVVAAGEVRFKEMELEDGITVFVVEKFTRQSNSYRPSLVNKYLTGFPEEAYVEFDVFAGNEKKESSVGRGDTGVSLFDGKSAGSSSPLLIRSFQERLRSPAAHRRVGSVDGVSAPGSNAAGLFGSNSRSPRSNRLARLALHCSAVMTSPADTRKSPFMKRTSSFDLSS